MNDLIIILTHDGDFVAYGHMVGLEMVCGDMGWFPSLILRTTHGEELQGYMYMVRPYSPHLQVEFKPMLLEWHDADAES